jgi:Asp-tRNA(Asn)/Glu-tRNA(Gln) amidotransferase A subunit family amidase
MERPAVTSTTPLASARAALVADHAHADPAIWITRIPDAEVLAALRDVLDHRPASLHPTTRAILEGGLTRLTVDAFDAFHDLALLRRRAADFDPDVRDRLIAGAMVPAVMVQAAQVFRRWYRAQVLALFAGGIDAILAPATPTSAPALGRKTFVLDGVELPVRANIGIFTQPISFVGLPVVAVPVFASGMMPIGVQVIAAPWREDIALRIARHLEREGIAQVHRPGQGPEKCPGPSPEKCPGQG